MEYAMGAHPPRLENAGRDADGRRPGRLEKENMTTKEKEEVETEREGSDGPLLDLSDDAVKKMIKAAKKRGYVTMDELNSVLPSEEVTSEQIEDTMAMLSDMGINV